MGIALETISIEGDPKYSTNLLIAVSASKKKKKKNIIKIIFKKVSRKEFYLNWFLKA